MNYNNSVSRIGALILPFVLVGCLNGSSGDGSFGEIIPPADGGTGNAAVSITSYNPGAASVTVLSSTSSSPSQTFSITATSSSQISYSWTLNGASVGVTSSYTLSSTTTAVGTYTLIATATDESGYTASQAWSVTVNAKPAISAYTPTKNTKTLNYTSSAEFNVTASDSNSNQTLTYVWKFNGSTSAPASTFITDQTDTATTSTIDFSTNGNTTYIGSNTVSVTVSDGHEEATRSWTLESNYFSDECNNLTKDMACTILGNPSIGDNQTRTSTDFRVQPASVLAKNGLVYFGDETNSVVFVCNQTGTDITGAFGQDIPSNKCRVILGTRSAMTSTAVSSGRSFKIRGPRALAVDSSGNLYVANIHDDNIVRVLYSGGAASLYLNAGSCTDPSGMVYDSTNGRLWVSCQGEGRIKYLTAPNTVTVLGDPASVCPNCDMPVAARPGSLDLDEDNNLYIAYSNLNAGAVTNECTVGVFVMPGNAAITWFGNAITTPGASSDATRIAGSGSCAVPGVNTDFNPTTSITYPRGLSVFSNKSGFFVSSWDNHTIYFYNNSGVAKTYGGASIGINKGAAIAGVINATGTGSSTYIGDGANALGLRLTNPIDVSIMKVTGSTGDHNKLLFVADYTALRLRVIALDGTNSLNSPAGTLPVNHINTYSGTGRTTATFNGTEGTAINLSLSGPRGIDIDKTNRKLYVADTGNARVRMLNLLTGHVTSPYAVGSNGANVADYASAMRMTNVWDAGVTSAGHVAFTNSHDATYYNCVLNLWNTSAASITSLYGQNFPDGGWAAVIAGSAGSAGGCGLWNSAATGINAILDQMRGITTYGTDIYFANYAQSCIHKIDTTGAMLLAAGDCSSTTDIFNPGFIAADPTSGNGSATAQNLFYVNRYQNAASSLKYINNKASNVNIMGTVVTGNTYTSLLTAAYMNGVAASSTELCYSSGNAVNQGTHTVACYNISSSLPTITIGSSAIAAGGPVGKGGASSGGQEGILASQIYLNAPEDLAFDECGDLYISDRVNNIIRKVKRTDSCPN